MKTRYKTRKLFCLGLVFVLIFSTITCAYASSEEVFQPDGNGPKPTKYVIRSRMEMVVTGGRVLGYDMASYFLEHSLVDSPTDLSYANGSTYSNQIKNSAEYKSILSGIKSALRNTTKTTYSTSDSTILNSTTELHLALNKVNYTVSATKSGGKWSITIVFSDIYNFEYAEWGSYSNLSGTAATALNNYGVYAMEEGAVVAFDISIAVTDTYSV